MPAAISLEVFEDLFRKRLVTDPQFKQMIRNLFDKVLLKNRDCVLAVMAGSWISKPLSVEILIDGVLRKTLLKEEDQELRSQYRSIFSQYVPDMHVLIWLVNVPVYHKNEYHIPEDFQHRLLLLTLPKSAAIDIPAAF